MKVLSISMLLAAVALARPGCDDHHSNYALTLNSCR